MEKYLAVEEYSVILPCSLIEIVHWENLKSGGTNHNFSFVNICPLKNISLKDPQGKKKKTTNEPFVLKLLENLSQVNAVSDTRTGLDLEGHYPRRGARAADIEGQMGVLGNLYNL